MFQVYIVYIYPVELYSNLTHFVETPTLVAYQVSGNGTPGYFTEI